MARNSFNARTGGLVNSVVANVATSIGTTAVTSIGNIGNPNPATGGFASFSVNSLLANTIKNTTGVALNAGENYLMSQIGSVLPQGENNALLNSVTTQIAQAGVQKLTGFVSQSIGGLFGGGAPNVTTAGLSGQASRSSKSISPDAIKDLPAADYGGSAYTLDDIVFTLVPANAGAQTAPQPQSKPLIPLDTAFNSNVNLGDKSLAALKGATAYTLPATGSTVNSFGGGGSSLIKTPALDGSKLKANW